MRKKILNETQESWLYRNYRNKSNDELAEELTKMIHEEYDKELQFCIVALQNCSGYKERCRIVSRMCTLKGFDKVTERFVINEARRLRCGKKTPECISRMNRQKALTAYWKKMLPTAELIVSPYVWFRSFKLKDQKVGILADKLKYNSMRNSICNWNREVGVNEGIVLVPEWNKALLAVKIEAKSIY